MNKDKYLDELYIELQKYDASNPVRHVSEYDYIISDMLDEMSMEDVVSQLGTADVLAASIAEEFEYTFKDEKQFEKSILSSDKTYTMRNKDYSNIVKKIIDVIFVIGSIIFFLGLGGMLIVMVSVLALGSIAFGAVAPSILFGFLTLSIALLGFFLYMLVLNIKHWLVNRLFYRAYSTSQTGTSKTTNNEEAKQEETQREV